MSDFRDMALESHRIFEREQWPFYWLTRVVGRYLQQLERRLKKIGLDVPRWRVLMCLEGDEAISVSEIAELAIVKLPTMMKIVQRMQAEGLVTCSARVSDGRVTEVRLTDVGAKARKAALEIAMNLYERSFREVSPDREARLNEDLRMLFRALED